MSTPKKTKPTTVEALQAKLADYAKTIEAQRTRLMEMSERLTKRDEYCAEMNRRVNVYNNTMAAIRNLCRRFGVECDDNGDSVLAVERLAVSRIGDFQRIERERSNAVMHRQTMQDVLESVGYTVEYGNNGARLSIQRKQSEVAKVKTPWWHRVLDITGYVLIGIALGGMAQNMIVH